MSVVRDLFKGVPVILFQDAKGGHALGVVTTDGEGNAEIPLGITRDAGERLRISQITTLGDYKTVEYDVTHLLENNGTGSGSWGNSKYTMSVVENQYQIRASRSPHSYFSGKVQSMEFTFDTFAPQANVSKRVGYYSSSTGTPYNNNLDGLWLESASGTVSFRIARDGTDILSLPITSWSGYGNLSEYQTLSTWDNFTVCTIEFLWLGGAVAKLWVKTSKGFILAHEFNYSGTSKDVFTRTPNHPIRYEIRSSGGSGTLRYVCCMVATEGSTNESGRAYGVSSGHTTIAANVIGAKYVLIGVRKLRQYKNSVVRLLDASVLVQSNNDLLLWTIERNPTLTSPLSYTAVPGTSVEYALGNGTITVTGTGGITIGAGYISQGLPFPSNVLERDYLSFMGGSIDGTQDEFILCVTPITTNINSHGAITFKEY